MRSESNLVYQCVQRNHGFFFSLYEVLRFDQWPYHITFVTSIISINFKHFTSTFYCFCVFNLKRLTLFVFYFTFSKTARTHSDQAGNICQQLLAEHNPSGGAAASSMGAPGFIPADTEQSAPVMYNQNLSIPDRLGSGQIEGNPRKSAAAAVAAKLTSSASSAQMLSYVFSSLASEASTASQTKEPSSDLPPEKKSKHEIDQSYTPHHLQSPPDSLQNNMTTQQMTQDVPPPPPSSPPPPPPPPMQTYQVPQYVQNAGMSFSYNMTTPPPPTLPGYPSVAPPPLSGMGPFAPPPNNSYPAFQGSDGNFYNQPSSMPMAPISRQ